MLYNLKIYWINRAFYHSVFGIHCICFRSKLHHETVMFNVQYIVAIEWCNNSHLANKLSFSLYTFICMPHPRRYIHQIHKYDEHRTARIPFCMHFHSEYFSVSHCISSRPYVAFPLEISIQRKMRETAEVGEGGGRRNDAKDCWPNSTRDMSNKYDI